MKKYYEIMAILKEELPNIKSNDYGIILPVYWSEDDKGNIDFDIESIRQEFESFIVKLEEYNKKSEFDWDSI